MHRVLQKDKSRLTDTAVVCDFQRPECVGYAAAEGFTGGNFRASLECVWR